MSAVRGRVLWSGLIAASGIFLGACGNSEPTGNNGGTPANIAIAGGNGQVGLPGQTLTTPLAVKLTNAAGTPVQGSTVTFAVTSGAATVSPSSAVTDANGQARTVVTLGTTAGTVVVNATVSGTQLLATFVLTTGGSTTTACSGSSPQALTVGQVMTGLSGTTGICLSGGTAGSDFAVIGFYGNPDSSQVQSLTVRSTGATAIATASLVPALGATTATSLLRGKFNRLQESFDVALQRAAKQTLAPKLGGARSWYQRRSSAAAENAIPSSVTLGQVIALNAANDPARICDSVLNIGARVKAISNSAIIVADTSNPLPTISDAEYASLAATFDTLINPVDVQNFGQPTDIDRNGKILMFFTKEVNKLTPKNSSEGFIGGFFQERDLFPQTSTATLDGCPASNMGEMFYLLVPDSAGVFSVPHSKQDILDFTPSTLAHEYQHLINGSRRLYINDADQDHLVEDVWLGEGLSHIAEELLYYRAAGLTPRQNIDHNIIGASQAAVDAFNNDQGGNIGRYEVFLEDTQRASPYAENDNLDTRGATWSLLRYLADHRGAADADTWQKLVNTTLTGQANLMNVFGPDYMTQIRDWSTSVFTDDDTGVTDARFLQPSWNMRDIFPALCTDDQCTKRLGRFPLTVLGLADASPVTTSLAAGAATYIRFHVDPSSQASIDWSAGSLPVSPLMQFTVVRTR